MPAAWPPDLCNAALSRYSRQLLALHCPPEAPAPKRPWLAEAAWPALLAHARARKTYFQALRALRRGRAKWVFEAWARASPTIARPTLPPPEAYTPMLSRAFARAQRDLRPAAAAATRAAAKCFADWLRTRADGIAEAVELMGRSSPN